MAMTDGAEPFLSPPPSEDAVRSLVDGAVDRYVAARHAKVAAFIDANYSLAGALRLHRHAIGLDLLRAPANVALAVPFLVQQTAAAGLRAVGAASTARRLQGWKPFLDTDVARELVWRLHAELLELPYDDGRGRRCERDALAEEILADPQLTAVVDGLDALLVRQRDDPEFRQRLAEATGTYTRARTAAAELVNNLLLAGTGASAFHQLTPGALSLGPVIATAIAQQAAVAAFPLGAAAGGIWYGVFTVSPSAALVATVTGGLIGLGAAVAAFAGIVADPAQRALGIHARRLHRLIDALGTELKGGSGSFVVRDHYVARIFDLLDLARAAVFLAK